MIATRSAIGILPTQGQNHPAVGPDMANW